MPGAKAHLFDRACRHNLSRALLKAFLRGFLIKLRAKAPFLVQVFMYGLKPAIFKMARYSVVELPKYLYRDTI